MRSLWIFCLLLAGINSTAFASNKADLIEAQSWLRQYVNDSLSEEGVTRNSGSYRKAELEVLNTYFTKYQNLTKFNASELSDEQLVASMEIFTGMASIGSMVARDSEFYPAVREMASTALAVYQEIKLRRMPTEEEAALTYSAIFGLREWQLEARMRAELGPLHKIPYVIDDPGLGAKRSLWYLDPDLLTMKRIAFEPTENVTWIVIAFAGCSVAKEAISDITNDKALMGLFEGRSLWLTPPGADSDSFPDVFVWNARYPQFPLRFIHHMDEWPMLDIAPASPTFVRIKDGAVVGVHSGWGSGEYLPRTRKALLEIEAKAQ